MPRTDDQLDEMFSELDVDRKGKVWYNCKVERSVLPLACTLWRMLLLVNLEYSIFVSQLWYRGLD